MCTDCGCSITRSDKHHHHHDDISSNPQLNDEKTLSVIHKILDKNDVQANHNREHFQKHNISAYNLMSSPGSGKTTLLEHLVDHCKLNYAVVEGDLETSRDADRLKAKGIEAFQIQTGSACHLDAFMVHDALHNVSLEKADICFVENVGNLVCPASYDLGAHKNIVLLSVPEGDDKVEKYPVMFRRADLVIISKCDLLPYFDFDVADAKAHIHKLNPDATVLEVSTKEPETLKAVNQWLEQNHQDIISANADTA
ncbi:hydrogenase nickel incorporation protein HypB [Shewanella sp. WXL01]|uniref:hydrogenase nickel incorporation protein HypB n=1 Tax=Shewanella sp. WXL01 TaxID=2709721 RepID=UPI0014386833|nr:hydrogenase nickel incorporation protein HypB [Shewanella sp. WXL01]NKF50724.1 hydrogenase nickel incorporation protein HypB [Shewanella sp. WXL01]